MKADTFSSSVVANWPCLEGTGSLADQNLGDMNRGIRLRSQLCRIRKAVQNLMNMSLQEKIEDHDPRQKAEVFLVQEGSRYRIQGPRFKV